MPSRYRIIRRIDREGAVEVLEGTVHLEDGGDRRVAIKRLPRQGTEDQAMVRAFLNEARIVSRLRHPNLVPVIDFGLVDEAPFLVLELVEGVTLDELLKGPGAGIAPELGAYIAAETARGLAFLHGTKDEQGRSLKIVHRDVSRRNIMVTPQGEVRLGDLALARLLPPPPSRAAPELAGGDLDGRADVYGLGRTLAEMLGPEAGGNKALAAIITRATEADKRARFADAGEMAQALAAVVAARSSRDPRAALKVLLANDRRRDDSRTSDVRMIVPRPPTSDGIPRFSSSIEHDETEVVPSAITGGEPEPEVLESPVAVAEPRVGRDSITQPVPEPPAVRAEVRPAAATKPATEHVLSAYRLFERIGAGTWGEVYRGEQLVLGRTCAIKILRPALAAERRFVERLQREARALERLSHPRIVQLLDVGVTESGAPYLVMELLRGKTVWDLVQGDAGENPDGVGMALAPDRAANITLQIAEALAAAHQAGVAHRDLSARNVMVLPGDQVKVLDFGVTHTIDRFDDRTRLTWRNELIGTPSYMAPEQVLSAPDAGAPADLYSLGVILHQMVSGALPFRGTRIEVLQAQVEADAPPLPPSGGLDSLCRELMAKDPASRPTAPELIARIRELGFGVEAAATAIVPTTLPPPSTTIPSPPPPPEEAPGPWGLLLAALALGGGAAALWIAFSH
jgi:serine/threonine protein kinase